MNTYEEKWDKEFASVWSYTFRFTLTLLLGFAIAAYICYPKIGGNLIVASLLPLVLGTASLIVTVNNRHTSIADRARAMIDELYRLDTNQQKAPANRREHLESQLSIFIRRYAITLVASIAAYLSVFLELFAAIPTILLATPKFVLIEVISPPASAQSIGQAPIVGIAFFIFSLTAFVVSVAACILDMWLSRETLRSGVLAGGALSQTAILGPIQTSMIPVLANRYYQLREIQRSIEPNQTDKAINWARQFWEFQTEQFLYFRSGILPTVSYYSWLKRRLREFNECHTNGFVFTSPSDPLFAPNKPLPDFHSGSFATLIVNHVQDVLEPDFKEFLQELSMIEGEDKLYDFLEKYAPNGTLTWDAKLPPKSAG
jgi:hypothetical protein